MNFNCRTTASFSIDYLLCYVKFRYFNSFISNTISSQLYRLVGKSFIEKLEADASHIVVKKKTKHTSHLHTHYYNKISQYYSKMNSNGLNTQNSYC